MQFNVNSEVVNILNTIADRPELRRILWGYLFYLMLKTVPDLVGAIPPWSRADRQTVAPWPRPGPSQRSRPLALKTGT